MPSKLNIHNKTVRNHFLSTFPLACGCNNKSLKKATLTFPTVDVCQAGHAGQVSVTHAKVAK